MNKAKRSVKLMIAEQKPQERPLSNQTEFPPIPEDLEERLSIAWPDEKLAKLGPWQVKLLGAFLETEKRELTIPVLEGLLGIIESYFPEELIPLNPILKPLLQLSSQSSD